ncbi:AntiBacterial Factor related [Caenorhabditis elegans]|uniref:AntiBacterial Factor related n=1 Tax=Caenorhabditis elegans TaxID=6239 RepID=Q9XX40_CAEEL|nr:AntiBacterial Factor related [Caenorhabditis elegans]CAA20999.1 AntiBacterial Factor related [Caenorhabditis elegans]|eukprot:NP_507965.1 AntiBacterial Factor related [Caenorhabditis elegans]
MICNCFLLIIVTLVISNCDGICLNHEGWGNVGSVFTDPLCNVWCEIKLCGPGQCIEDPMTTAPARCVCEKCYRDNSGNAVYPGGNNDYQQQAQMNRERQLDRQYNRQLRQQNRMNKAWQRGWQ